MEPSLSSVLWPWESPSNVISPVREMEKEAGSVLPCSEPSHSHSPLMLALRKSLIPSHTYQPCCLLGHFTPIYLICTTRLQSRNIMRLGNFSKNQPTPEWRNWNLNPFYSNSKSHSLTACCPGHTKCKKKRERICLQNNVCYYYWSNHLILYDFCITEVFSTDC
jgi:hypothetical protein